MLINLRNALMAGKRWKNPYVTDGLISMWDGEWNAGGGKHITTTRDWVNLVQNSDIVARSNADISFGDKWCNSFSSNNIFQLNKKIVGSVQTEIVTVIPSSGQGFAYFFNGDTRTAKRYLYHYTSTVLFFDVQRTSNNAVTIPASATPLSLSIDYDALSVYENGMPVTSFKTYNDYMTSGTYNIGGRRTNSNPWQGRIYSIRVYSRALTAAEIAANYAIDKARFGLP